MKLRPIGSGRYFRPRQSDEPGDDALNFHSEVFEQDPTAVGAANMIGRSLEALAETTCGTQRLIVRRTRLLGAQAELAPDWRHFAFLTNRTEAIALVEAERCDHAVVEQVIADSKTRRWRTFPLATSTPTAPRRCWPP